MRTIKFRAICAFSGVWRYGFYYVSKGNHIIRDENDKESIVLEKTLGQFTGLHDKNGKEIYDGDILEYVRLGGSKIFYKVFYKKGGLVINIHQDDFKKDNPLFYEPIADMQTSGFIEQNCTIIGNIDENTELLSSGKK